MNEENQMIFEIGERVFVLTGFDKNEGKGSIIQDVVIARAFISDGKGNDKIDGYFLNFLGERGKGLVNPEFVWARYDEAKAYLRGKLAEKEDKREEAEINKAFKDFLQALKDKVEKAEKEAGNED